MLYSYTNQLNSNLNEYKYLKVINYKTVQIENVIFNLHGF
jgi:hypothetical protein